MVICNALETKLSLFDSKKIDYVDWLADKATSGDSEKESGFFRSENFYRLSSNLANFRKLKVATGVKLEDYIRSQVQESID